MPSDTIAVIGAGSWGSAMAIHLARNGRTVYLWEYQIERLKEIEKTRTNFRYLPDVSFPDSVIIEPDLNKCVANQTIIFLAVPSNAFSETLKKIKPSLSPNTIISWGTKGLVNGKFLHEVALAILGDAYPLVVLSGPSFAKEVAKGLPTAVVVASRVPKSAELMAEYTHSDNFRPYLSSDVQGVEVGGVVKNVLAIAVGISDGLGFGANARAALVTRGLLEMKALGIKLGAMESTFNGLAGLGDLILTATDNQSRNRRFGIALGEGLTTGAAKSNIGQVVEGVRNASEIHELANKLQVDMPICELVYKIIYEEMKPLAAVSELLKRDIKSE